MVKMTEESSGKRKALKKRVLVFTFDSSYHIETYDRISRYMENENFEFIFLTSNPSSKMELYRRGQEAYSLTELIGYLQYLPKINIDDRSARKMYGYDYKVKNLFDFPAEARWKIKTVSESYYHWVSELFYTAMREFFNIVAPSVVFTWNTCTLQSGVISKIAAEERVPVFYLERGLLPYRAVIDPDGVNYGSHIAGDKWRQLEVPYPDEKEIELADRFCCFLQEREATIVPSGWRKSETDIRLESDIPPDASVLFFPLQIEKDSNILNYSPFYKTMPEIILDLAKIVEKNENLYVIIKPHPEDQGRFEHLKNLCSSKMFISNDYNLDSLFKLTDVVVVVNSTVGLEALTRGKQVVVLGKAIYGEKGFTFDLDHPEKLEETIFQALEAANKRIFNEKGFKRFLVYLLKNCLFSLVEEDPFESRANIISKINSRINGQHVESRSGSELLENLSQNREEIENFFQRIEAGEIGVKDVLLIKPYAKTPKYMSRLLKGEVQVIDRKNLLTRLPKVLIKKYEYIICFGMLTRRVRLLMRITRANKKIYLV